MWIVGLGVALVSALQLGLGGGMLPPVMYIAAIGAGLTVAVAYAND